MEDKITLYEEFRLIEKSESEINAAWKGAHLLLFFLSFVFGSFCTFCFHVLMYLFDEKCILFPKLISLKDVRRSSSSTGVILDYIAKKEIDELPVDFVTTQWMDASACYLPRYVPLLSGICGLVWTTMFLMCSSGSRSLTGLQRPWRILPPVFLFSLAMGSLCLYTSCVTQSGLEELCAKLGEFTGSSTCSYTINVATLAYERRIRGVYQATRLTMVSAWLHTLCWIGAALLALVRVILVVDFRLVRVRADLKGNIDQMLERQEKHIRTDEYWNKYDKGISTDLSSSDQALQFVSRKAEFASHLSLLPEEQRRVSKVSGYHKVSKEHRFIVTMLADILGKVTQDSSITSSYSSSPESLTSTSQEHHSIRRAYGQRCMKSGSFTSLGNNSMELTVSPEDAKEIAVKFREEMKTKLRNLVPVKIHSSEETLIAHESFMNLTPEMKAILDEGNRQKKSNLKSVGVETNDAAKRQILPKVQLQTPKHSLASMKTLTVDDEASTSKSPVQSDTNMKDDEASTSKAPVQSKPTTKDTELKDKDATNMPTDTEQDFYVLFDAGLFNEQVKEHRDTMLSEEQIRQETREKKETETETEADTALERVLFLMREIATRFGDTSNFTFQPPNVDKETQTPKKEKQD